MKKLLLCLVALFAAIGAQASSETIEKGFGTSGTSTVKFGATGKDDITAKAVYTLTLNADNKLKVELTFADLNNSDVEGLGNDPCYMFIDGIGETSLSYADGKYTGTTSGTATPGNFYSNCYFKRACANTGANYGENGQLIFPFQFTAPKEGIYFDLKLGEPTVTTNSYSFPYEIVVHPEDTDLTDAEYKTWIQFNEAADNKEWKISTTKNGTIEHSGLYSNTTYNLYPRGEIILNGTTYFVTNNDKNFTIKTLENSADVKFSIEAEQTAATSSSVTMHYKFVPTGEVPEGTTYRLWFDVESFANPEVYSTDAEGDITVTGLEPNKSYRLWTKGYYTLPNSGEQKVANFDNVFNATTSASATESEISGVVSDITATTATLTLTCKPAEGKTVDKIVVSGLGEGKDITLTSTDNLTANLTDLTPGTTYNLIFTLTYTDNSTTTSTVSFTTPTAPKEVSMEFIPVNVSDLSALFRLKVQLIDNATSKESIHMYLRKADETPEATADDPYAKYGEAKGTPAVDMREGIENPIYFNYTELEKNTKYVATAVVKKDGYTGIATTEFETLGEANGTTSYIENGYFRDGKATTSDDGQELKMTYLATARYTFTYDKDNETLYLTFDTRIRNNPDLPAMQAKYILNVGDQTYYGAPLTNAAGFKDHYSFIINYRCPDIAKHIANGDKMTFTYFTDYAEGGQSFFGGVQYDGTTSSVDFGEPADIEWIAYSYAEQQEQNKNRYDLYKLKPKTQLMATVVDKEGHYLPRRIVQFEMAAEHADKADVTYDLFAEQPKWFVEAKALDAGNEVDFEVVAYHELETADSPAAAPRRAVSADGKRLEAKRGFHYIESETATGIDDIEADDANAPVRYFDLNGREISEPQKGMFVIRLQGSKATKMIAE